jgi:hypothetical protein
MSEQNPPRERLLALDQIAEEAQVSRATIWRWVEQDDLPTYKLEGDTRTFVDRADLLRSLAAARRGKHRAGARRAADADQAS